IARHHLLHSRFSSGANAVPLIVYGHVSLVITIILRTGLHGYILTMTTDLQDGMYMLRNQHRILANFICGCLHTSLMVPVVPITFSPAGSTDHNTHFKTYTNAQNNCIHPAGYFIARSMQTKSWHR